MIDIMEIKQALKKEQITVYVTDGTLFMRNDRGETIKIYEGVIKPCTREFQRVYMQGWNEGRRKLVEAMEKEIAI